MVKKAFSLIEVMIALGILSVALTSLFFWYQRVAREKKEIVAMTAPLIEERYCQIRLERILPKICKGEFFFSDQAGCLFIFDHGSHLFSEFSGPILGKLYCNNNTLLMTMWPHPTTRKRESLTIPLLDHVDQLSFAFYHPPEDKKKIVDPEEIKGKKPSKGWNFFWKKEYEVIPHMIKVIVKRGGRDIEFTYFLEESQQSIKYYSHL